jgi:hypothetical protein
MSLQQLDYIKHFVDSFEYALDGPNFVDSLIGYSKYIDVNSFIDFYIVNELSKNPDGYRHSTFIYKDRDDNGGKLTMGPLWDFNMAYGWNIPHDTDGWVEDDYLAISNPFWFSRLLDDTMYQNKLKCRWEYLRAKTLHKDSLFNFIDSISFYLDSAQQRNFQKWHVLGPLNDFSYSFHVFYQKEIDILKAWLEARLVWLDSNMLGNCYITNPIE